MYKRQFRDLFASEEDTPETKVTVELGWDALHNAVNRLPDRQREVLTLHLYQGLDYREIAAALGCTYDDVKMNLSLARKRLKEELKGYL